MTQRLGFWALSALALVVGAATVFAADPLETFTGFGVHMAGGKSGAVIIGIDRWSTDEERQMLLGVLRDKGQNGLIEALKKTPRVGYIRLASSRGYDLRFARSTDNPDGSRRVVVATDRPLQFREVATSTRSRNYDFGVVEMHFPKGEKGEGKLAPATMIEIDKESNTLEIKNYGGQPVRVMNITSKKP